MFDIRYSKSFFTTSTTITLTKYTAPFNVQLFSSSAFPKKNRDRSGTFSKWRREAEEKSFELGREVPLQFHSTQQGSRTVLIIDRSALPGCMYFLSITSKEKREVKVMVGLRKLGCPLIPSAENRHA
ncbi:MAG: hypothetical protein ABIQ74_00575 [Chitinophagales bacterium]